MNAVMFEGKLSFKYAGNLYHIILQNYFQRWETTSYDLMLLLSYSNPFKAVCNTVISVIDKIRFFKKMSYSAGCEEI
jgi:hypothetical protein